MIINPKDAVKRGWINNVGKGCIQPNSIDVRINKLFRMTGELVLSVQNKPILCNWVEVLPDTKKNYFCLEKFVAYQFEALEYVRVPKGVVMRLYMRSTLNRSGIFVGAGLWDSGFENYVGASFYPFMDAYIEKGARIAQVVFMEAEDSGDLYNGSYKIN